MRSRSPRGAKEVLRHFCSISLEVWIFGLAFGCFWEPGWGEAEKKKRYGRIFEMFIWMHGLMLVHLLDH